MEWKITIKIQSGFCLEELSRLWTTASRFKSRIQIRIGKIRADAKSFIEVLALLEAKGRKLEIIAWGVDAQKGLEAIRKLILEDPSEKMAAAKS